ncbi:hypothetical protein BDF20DRAFT_912301 [Mycotypha africana]|uniref:uncharacterized protein n=1 Tax=Mycotypha africana TaxID=64632 RepID=UPI002301F43A|nr:uncharacterized protein BDF20DRAFT_912301 [Mycotypha africana]KAI8982090.1 hypothetical protein BDF20DRAFT_912301 [Mycotypha africana]
MECQFVKSIACLVPPSAPLEGDNYQLMATPNDAGVEVYLGDGTEERSYQYSHCITPELVENTYEKEQAIVDLVLHGYSSTILMLGKGDTNVYQQRKKDTRLLLDMLMDRINAMQQQLQEQHQQKSDPDLKSPFRIEYAYLAVSDRQIIDIRKDEEYTLGDIQQNNGIDFLMKAVKNFDDVKSKARHEIGMPTLLSIKLTNNVDGVQGRLQIMDIINPPFNTIPANNQLNRSIYYSFKALCEVVDSVTDSYEGRLDTDGIILTKLLTPALCGEEQLTILAYYNTRVSKEALDDLTACLDLIEKFCQIAIRTRPTIQTKNTVEYKRLHKKVIVIGERYKQLAEEKKKIEDYLSCKQNQVNFLEIRNEELRSTTVNKQAAIESKAELAYAEAVISMRNFKIENLEADIQTERNRVEHLTSIIVPQLTEKLTEARQEIQKLQSHLQQYETVQGSQRAKVSEQSQELERLRTENRRLQEFNNHLKETNVRLERDNSELETKYQSMQEELRTAQNKLITVQREHQQQQLAGANTDTEVEEKIKAAVKKVKDKYKLMLTGVIEKLNNEREEEREQIKQHYKAKQAKLMKQFEEDLQLVREAEQAKYGGDIVERTRKDLENMTERCRTFKLEIETLQGKLKEYEQQQEGGLEKTSSAKKQGKRASSSTPSSPTSEADTPTAAVDEHIGTGTKPPETKNQEQTKPSPTVQTRSKVQTKLVPTTTTRPKRTIRPDSEEDAEDEDDEDIQTVKPIRRTRARKAAQTTSVTTAATSTPPQSINEHSNQEDDANGKAGSSTAAPNKAEEKQKSGKSVSSSSTAKKRKTKR